MIYFIFFKSRKVLVPGRKLGKVSIFETHRFILQINSLFSLTAYSYPNSQACDSLKTNKSRERGERCMAY